MNLSAEEFKEASQHLYRRYRAERHTNKKLDPISPESQRFVDSLDNDEKPPDKKPHDG